MADGTAWRTALGALSALGLVVLGVTVVPPLLTPGGPALDAQVAALPGVETTPDEPASSGPAATPPAGVAVVDATTNSGGPAVQGNGTAPPAPEPREPAAQVTETADVSRVEVQPTQERQEEAAPVSATPSFDAVRVEPDGSGLIAGRAEPGASVAILAGEAVAAEVMADPEGRFVAFFELTPSSQPRVLVLRDGSGILSAETVIIPPNAADEEVAALGPAVVAAPLPSPDAAPVGTKEPTGGQGGASVGPSIAAAAPSIQPELSEGSVLAGPTRPVPGPFRPSAPAPDSAPEPSSLPVVASTAPRLPDPGASLSPAQDAVLLSDADGVRVVQPALAPGASPEVLATVALDSIAYEGSGEVVLSGRATDQGAIRLYLDNAPAADATIAPDGTWSVPLTGAAPGIYTLRVDQLDESGDVVSRIETPFQREERVSLEAALAEVGRMSNGIALRTVQPGNTLWAIARERYGEPRLYLRVFEANRDRIRNPDLIYPGQVFVLPDID